MVNTRRSRNSNPEPQNRRLLVRETVLELVTGDITAQTTDAIVNAANSSLMGGGGVDGAIHRAAGPELLKETRTLGGCKTGDAKLSGGHRLPVQYIIHTVGPIYRANDPLVPQLLASAYRRSMEIALENDIRSLAFPAISTGIYGYPMRDAAAIALETIIDFIRATTTPADAFSLVRFVLYTPQALDDFAAVLDELAGKHQLTTAD
ncbi:MAG: O-acetyl-ADP-ribose deacetylase [Anaerolineaceae bacterium]|nr:MAG: O-acetyl-ADP-ribose deacetylase [Anaerolineaceae bacterium]